VTRPRLATAPEVAAVLGVSRQRIHQLIVEGRIPAARRLGRDWLIPVDADGRPRVTPTAPHLVRRRV